MAKDFMETTGETDHMSYYWKKEWKVVGMVVISGTIFNACMSFGPILQGKVIDEILSGKRQQMIWLTIAAYVAVRLGTQMFRYVKRYYVRVFANRTSASMRKVVYHNIVNMKIEDLKNESTGDLMAKAISDVGECSEGMRKFTTEVFDTGVLMTSYFIAMLCQDWKLSLGVCIFIPIAMFMAERLKKVIYKYTKDYRKEFSKVSELTYETADHMLLYRMNSVAQQNIEVCNQSLKCLEKKAVMANLLENSMQPIYNAISALGIVGLIYFGGRNVIHGSWTVGEFSAYVTIFGFLCMKSSKAAKLFNSVQKARVSWDRIKPYLAKPIPLVEESNVSTCTNPVLELKDMSFAYENQEATIEHVSFRATKGDVVGITGPVASGKSTIGFALQGLYPYQGSILVNGRELSSYSKKDISKVISYMGHNSHLLSDTIYNNITLGKEGDITQVLSDVCFLPDLKGMEHGVDTLVGAQGVRLSGGQQARLALARALYHSSEILVLDDPFASVDKKTEFAIMDNLRKHYQDKIILLISHRIAYFKEASQVLVVNHGKVKSGTHEELLKTSKTYRAINALQEVEENE